VGVDGAGGQPNGGTLGGARGLEYDVAILKFLRPARGTAQQQCDKDKPKYLFHADIILRGAFKSGTFLILRECYVFCALFEGFDGDFRI